MPPMLGLPALLEKLGLLSTNEQGYDHDAQIAGNVMFPQEPNGLQHLAQLLGLAPHTGEQNGEFWNRQMPGGSLPPGLRQGEGKDIELPSDVRRKQPR